MLVSRHCGLAAELNFVSCVSGCDAPDGCDRGACAAHGRARGAHRRRRRGRSRRGDGRCGAPATPAAACVVTECGFVMTSACVKCVCVCVCAYGRRTRLAGSVWRDVCAHTCARRICRTARHDIERSRPIQVTSHIFVGTRLECIPFKSVTSRIWWYTNTRTSAKYACDSGQTRNRQLAQWVRLTNHASGHCATKCTRTKFTGDTGQTRNRLRAQWVHLTHHVSGHCATKCLD